MASMVQNCPPEIISAICKVVADDDAMNTLINHEAKFKNIKSCSASCRTFLPHCREYMFDTIVIHDSYDPKDRTAEKFTQLIKDTPQIADYVRVLKYGMRLHDDLHYGAVVSALDKLTGLKSLSVNIQGYCQGWKNIPASTQSSLLRLIHLPTLVSLELRYIDGLDLNLLPPCPNLQDLRLYTITFHDEDKPERSFYDDEKKKVPEPPAIVPLDSIRPTNLRIANTPESESSSFSMLFDLKRQDGRPVFDFSSLKSVSFMLKNDRNVELMMAILPSIQMLESLEIIAESDALMESGAECIQKSQAHLSALKSLSFKVYLVPETTQHPSHPLPGICAALSDIPAKQTIEVVKIRVSMYANFFTRSGVELWGDLDRTITSASWPALRQVQLEILTYAREKGVVEELRKLSDTQFPNISLQQNFKFNFSVSGP